MATEALTDDVAWSIAGAFARGWYSTERPDPVFIVGSSDPAVDWPQTQPGPLDAGHGFRPAAATIVFEGTADAAAHWHELRLEGVASNGPCPDLTIGIGGRSGLVVLTPQRLDRTWAPTLQQPIAGRFERTVTLPPGTVRPGRNELVLTTTADELAPDERREPRQPLFSGLFGSALTWSGLTLRRLHGETAAAATLTPSPLYVTRDGRLHELVDVLISDAAGLAADVDVTIGDHAETLAVEPVPFGDVRWRVAVPAFDEPVAGRIVVRDDASPIGWAGQVTPCRRWTLHLIPHVHLDVGYTDNQAKVIELHNRNIERALAAADETQGYAFSVDGSFVLRNYLQSRDGKRAEQALNAVRDGRLGLNAFYWLFLSGVASLEECYRAAYFAAGLRRDHGLPITYANLTDVPSYPTAMPSIVAALGLDTFFGIANHTRGGSDDGDALQLLSPVRWEGPDGASVLAYFADSYTQLRFICADPPTVAGGADGLTRFVAPYDRPDYLPDHLPIVGTHVDNEDLADGYADFVQRWNDTYTYPRLRFSTIADYADAVRPLLDRLPTLRGDGGSYWEDGVGTQARAAATHRRTQALLPAAETLTSLVATVYEGLAADVSLLDTAWDRLLLGSEHTWTSAHATERPHSHHAHDQLAWKVGQINDGLRLATDIARQALSRLAEKSTTGREGVIVFNALPWTRDAEVEIELEDGIRLETASGEVVPADPGPLVDGYRVTRLRVSDLPPLGYRAFVPRHDGAAPLPEDEPVGPSFETAHYRVELDPESGRLRRLVHRATGRALADAGSDYALGEVIYVSGGGTEEGRGLGAEQTSLWGAGLPAPELTVTPADLRLVGIRRTAWGWVVETEGTAPSIPALRCRWHFPDADDRVEYTVDLTKQPVLAKESVYVAFPFALDQAAVRYDRQQGWVDPARDHQPGACNEWFTVAQAVTLTDAGGSIGWTSADAPLFALGDVVRGRWSSQPPASTGLLLSWVMNNYWFTNTPASQDGDLTLRYAFRPFPDFDPAGATRLGRELRTPALAGEVTSLDKGDANPRPLPAEGSLLRTAMPGHVDATIYAGRVREGVLVRLREVAGHSASATVWHPSPSPAATALRCNAAEDPMTELPVAADGAVIVPVGPYEVVTVLLAPA